MEQAAEKNDPDAEYALGYMYYNGIGTVSDPDTAYIWIQRAADQGQPLAVKAIHAIRAAQFPKMGKVNIKAKAVKQSRKARVQLAYKPKQSKASAREVTKVALAHTLKQKTTLGNVAIKNMPADHYTLQLLAAHKLANVMQYRKALKDADTFITSESRAFSLETLYALGRINEIFERIEKNPYQDDEDLRLAAFSSFISAQEKRNLSYSFCQNPLSFLNFSSLF